jgi:hypothetical protein
MSYILNSKEEEIREGECFEKTGRPAASFSREKERVPKILLDIKKAQLIYSPKSDLEYRFSREAEVIQRKNWRIYDKAHSYYNRKWYKKAKEEFLKIDNWHHTSKCFETYILRTYRKLINSFIEKGKYRDALSEMDEMFEKCANTTNTDIKKYNKIVEMIKKEDPGVDAEPKEISAPEPEFTIDSSLVRFISQFSKPRGFNIIKNEELTLFKVHKLSHLLPESLPYISFHEGQIEYIVPKDYLILTHEFLCFKEAENRGNFAICSRDLNLSILNRDFEQIFTYDISGYAKDYHEIECVDVSADLSHFLFTIRGRVFVLDTSSIPKIVFYWKTPDVKRYCPWDNDDKITGTFISGDASRIYLGCSSGKIFRLNRNGEVKKIYVLPFEFRNSYSISDIIESKGYLHIMVDIDICIIKENQLVRVVKIAGGSVKWFSLGFIHLVDNTIDFFSHSGIHYASLKLKRKIRHICYLNNYIIVDTDKKSFVFKLDENQLVLDDKVQESVSTIENSAAAYDEDVAIIDVEGNDIPIQYDQHENEFDTEAPEIDTIEGFKTIEDYIKLAEAVIEDLKDAKAARELYQQAEKQIRKIEDCLKLAESVFENLLEKAWAEELIERALKYTIFYSPSKEIEVYIKLAEFIAGRLGNEEWAKEIYRKISDITFYPRGLIALAVSILTYLGEKKWAISIYKQVERRIDYNHDYIELAGSIFKNLNDIQWTRSLYRKVEANINHADNFINLAEAVLETLQDKEWAKVLYKRAEINIYYVGDYIELAGSLADVLKEKQWALEIYKKAHEKVSTKDEYVKLAVSLLKNLKDKAFAKNIFKEAEALINNIVSYRYLAESISNHIDDKSFVIEVYRRIEERTRTAIGFIELSNLVSKYLSDKKWLRRLYLKAAEKIKNFVEFRKLGESMVRHLNDKDFEKKLYIEFLHRSPTMADFIKNAELISTFLNDVEFAQKACKDVDIRFLTKKELEKRFEAHTGTDCFENLPPRKKIEHLRQFFPGYKINRYIKTIYLKSVHIFLELDKIEALRAYLEYSYLSLEDKKEIKPLPTKVRKRVFKDKKQYEDFLHIIDTLKVDKNKEAVLLKIKQLFIQKKKKIELNRQKIVHIHSQHSATVKKLNEVLLEGEEIEAPRTPGTNTTSPSRLNLSDIFASHSREGQSLSSIPFSPVQVEILKRILEKNYILTHSEASQFAYNHKIFKNQLINSINELFAEFFDDTLIEESEETYTINPEYRYKNNEIC